MRIFLLPLRDRRVFFQENKFFIFSFLLHFSVLTLLSYSPVVTEVAMPASQIDMLNVEAETEKTDAIKIEAKTEVEENKEPVYIERKVVPLTAVKKANIYLPIFEVNTLPKIKVWINPEYPPSARRLGIESSIIVEIDIDENGLVMEARIVKGAEYGFNQAALKAIKQVKFVPALKAGKPVPVRVRLPIKFELE